MKILLLDIETSPNTAYVWRLFKENIPLARLIESSNTLCWSAKWYGSKEMFFDSIHQSSRKGMLKGIHNLLDQSDAVVHFNGQAFDIPVLNREFLLNKMYPPAPYKQIDLLTVCRKQFSFVSNKLAHVTKELGIEGKVNETDFTLWIRCMNNDPAAWKIMETYNKTDVVVLEKVYDRLLPWIKSHPNHGLYSGGGDVCVNCGSTHLQRRGFAYTAALKYQRFQCADCGNWMRSKKPIDLDKKAQYGNII